MASNNISILIKAEDQATPALRKVAGAIDDTGKSANEQSSLVQRLSNNWGVFAGVSAGAGVAVYGLFGQMQKANDEAKTLQMSLAGLSSVARGFNVDAGAAERAARSLASDGLMTVADAATGLKNLLASGFSLPEAIQLMKGFKDQAVNNRQSYYDLGGAVRATTEGIRNGNSVLADATGTTKNLSVMAKEAGIGIDQMGSISQNASYRQAVLNGFLTDTARSAGDAARYLDTAAGKEAEASAQTTILYQQIGLALQPALLVFLQTLTPIIVGISQWVSENQGLAATLLIGTTVVLGLIAVMGTLATAVVATRVVVSTFGPTAVASVSLARGAFLGFQALVASPIAMPAIVVAAAIASLYQVVQAVNTVKGAIDALNSAAAAKAAAAASDADAHNQLVNLSRNGTPEQKARANNLLAKGFASGGYTGYGGTNEVAGVVHKGEYVVPKAGVDQQTGLPKGMGSTIVNINGTINIATPEAADAWWNRIDKTQRLAAVGMA